jgi:MoxR-like ATPase
MRFNGRKRASSFRRGLAIFLSMAVFQSSLAPAWAESSFWRERRRAVHQSVRPSSSDLLASLPAGRVPPPLVSHSFSEGPFPAAPAALLTDQSLPGWMKSLPWAHADFQKVSRASWSSPWVVLLQDLHGQEEAQQSISRILRGLSDLSSSLGGQGAGMILGVEGATGPFDFGPYRRLARPEVVQKTADHLLSLGYVGGAQHFGLTADNPLPMVGLEAEADYLANIRALRESRAALPAFEKTLQSWSAALAALKKRAFSGPLFALDLRCAQFQAGKLSLKDYLKGFGSPVDQGRYSQITRFLQASALEYSLDFSTVEKERNVLLTALTAALSPPELQALIDRSLATRAGQISTGDYYGRLKDLCQTHGFPLSRYPVFDRYVQYVLMSDAIDRRRFHEELVSFEEAAIQRLAATPEEHRLWDAGRDLSLVEKMVRQNLTTQEWETYQSRLSEIHRLPERLSIKEAGNSLPLFETFYTAARRRDDSLSDNLLKALVVAPFTRRSPYVAGENSSINRATTRALEQVPHAERPKLPEAGPRAILIAGGFHAPGLTRRLNEKGFNVLTVSPKVGKIVEGDYLNIFSHSPLDKILAGEKLFIVYPLLPGATHRPEGYDAEGKAVDRQAASELAAGEASLRLSENQNAGTVARDMEAAVSREFPALPTPVINVRAGKAFFQWKIGMRERIADFFAPFRTPGLQPGFLAIPNLINRSPKADGGGRGIDPSGLPAMARRFRELHADMLKAADTDREKDFQTAYREMLSLADVLSPTVQKSSDPEILSALRSQGAEIKPEQEKEAVSHARAIWGQVGAVDYSPERKALHEEIVKEMVEELFADPGERQRWTQRLLADIQPPDLRHSLPENLMNDFQKNRPFLAGSLSEMDRFYLSWGALNPTLEKVFLKTEIQDPVTVRVTLKHEMLHRLAQLGVIKIPMDWETITFAVDILERVRWSGEDSLARPEVVGEYGDLPLQALYARGKEMGVSGETGFVVRPGVSGTRAEYFGIDALLAEARRVYEKQGVNADPLTDSYGAQQAVAALVAGIMKGRKEKDPAFQPLKTMKDFFEVLHSRFAPPSTEDLRWLGLNPETGGYDGKGLLKNLLDYTTAIAGERLEPALQEQGLWRHETVTPTTGKLHLVPSDLFPRPWHGATPEERREKARERGLGHALLAYYRTLFGGRQWLEKDSGSSLAQDGGFQALWTQLRIPSVVSGAFSSNRKKVESGAVLKEFDGAALWVRGLFEDRYDVDNADVAEALLTALPPHLQFLDTLLYRWHARDPRSTKTPSDPRLRSPLVRQAVADSFDAWSRVVFRPSSFKDDREFFTLLVKGVWPSYQKLYEEALAQEKRRRTYERMLQEELLQKNQQVTEQMLDQLFQQLPEDVREAIQQAVQEKMEQELEQFMGSPGSPAGSSPSKPQPGQGTPGPSAPSSGASPQPRAGGKEISMQGVQDRLQRLQEAVGGMENILNQVAQDMNGVKDAADKVGKTAQTAGTQKPGQPAHVQAAQAAAEAAQKAQEAAQKLLQEGRSLNEAAQALQGQAQSDQRALSSPEQGRDMSDKAQAAAQQAQNLKNKLQQLQEKFNQLTGQSGQMLQTAESGSPDPGTVQSQLDGVRESLKGIRDQLDQAKGDERRLHGLLGKLEDAAAQLEKSLKNQAAHRPQAPPSSPGDATFQPASASPRSVPSRDVPPENLPDLPDAAQGLQDLARENAGATPVPPRRKREATSLVTPELLENLKEQDEARLLLRTGLNAQERAEYEKFRAPLKSQIEEATDLLVGLISPSVGTKLDTHQEHGPILKHLVPAILGAASRAKRVDAEPLPVKISLMIDRSGSMKGDPLEAAQRTVTLLLEVLFNLNEKLEEQGYPPIEFEVGIFSDDPKTYISHQTSKEINGHQRERIIYNVVKQLVPDGGTNYAESFKKYVHRAVEAEDESGEKSTRILLIMSDEDVNEAQKDSVQSTMRYAEENKLVVRIIPMNKDLVSNSLAEHGEEKVIRPTPFKELPTRILANLANVVEPLSQAHFRGLFLFLFFAAVVGVLSLWVGSTFEPGPTATAMFFLGVSILRRSPKDAVSAGAGEDVYGHPMPVPARPGLKRFGKYRHFYTEDVNGRSFLVFQKPGVPELRWERGAGGDSRYVPDLLVPDTNSNEKRLLQMLQMMYREGVEFSSYSPDGRFLLRPADGGNVELFRRGEDDWVSLKTFPASPALPEKKSDAFGEVFEMPQGPGVRWKRHGDGISLSWNGEFTPVAGLALSDPSRLSVEPLGPDLMLLRDGAAYHLLEKGPSGWKPAHTLRMETQTSELEAEGKYVEMTGEPGLGKGTIGRALATLMNEEFHFVSGNGQMEKEDLDEYRVMGLEQPLVSGYLPSVVSRVRHYGGIVMIDESNKIKDKVLNSLKDSLAESKHKWRRKKVDPLTQKESIVQTTESNHPRARVLAASNDRHKGIASEARKNDQAMLRRKRSVHFTWDHPDEEKILQRELAKDFARTNGLYNPNWSAAQVDAFEDGIQEKVDKLITVAFQERLAFLGYSGAQIGQILKKWSLLGDPTFEPVNGVALNYKRAPSPRLVQNLVQHFLTYPKDWENRKWDTVSFYFNYEAEKDEKHTYATVAQDFKNGGFTDLPDVPLPRITKDSLEIKGDVLRLTPMDEQGRPSTEWDVLEVPLHPDAVARRDLWPSYLADWVEAPENAFQLYRLLQAYVLRGGAHLPGEPGSGKSTIMTILQDYFCGPDHETISMSEDTTKEEIAFSPHIGEGGVPGQSGFSWQPLPRAMDTGGHGKALVMGEGNQAPPSLNALVNEALQSGELPIPGMGYVRKKKGFGIFYTFNRPGTDVQVKEMSAELLERIPILRFNPLPPEKSILYMTKAGKKGSLQVNPRLLGEQALENGQPKIDAEGRPVWQGLLGVEQVLRREIAKDRKYFPRAPDLGTHKEIVRHLADHWDFNRAYKPDLLPQELLFDMYLQVFTLEGKSSEVAQWRKNLKAAFKEAGLWNDTTKKESKLPAEKDGVEDYLKDEPMMTQGLQVERVPKTGVPELDRLLELLQTNTVGSGIPVRIEQVNRLLGEQLQDWDTLPFLERMRRVYILKEATQVIAVVLDKRGPHQKGPAHNPSNLAALKDIQKTIQTLLVIQRGWPEQVLADPVPRDEFLGQYTLSENRVPPSQQDLLGKLELFHAEEIYAQGLLKVLSDHIHSRATFAPADPKRAALEQKQKALFARRAELLEIQVLKPSKIKPQDEKVYGSHLVQIDVRKQGAAFDHSRGVPEVSGRSYYGSPNTTIKYAQGGKKIDQVLFGDYFKHPIKLYSRAEWVGERKNGQPEDPVLGVGYKEAKTPSAWAVVVVKNGTEEVFRQKLADEVLRLGANSPPDMVNRIQILSEDQALARADEFKDILDFEYAEDPASLAAIFSIDKDLAGIAVALAPLPPSKGEVLLSALKELSLSLHKKGTAEAGVCEAALELLIHELSRDSSITPASLLVQTEKGRTILDKLKDLAAARPPLPLGEGQGVALSYKLKELLQAIWESTTSGTPSPVFISGWSVSREMVDHFLKLLAGEPGTHGSPLPLSPDMAETPDGVPSHLEASTLVGTIPGRGTTKNLGAEVSLFSGVELLPDIIGALAKKGTSTELRSLAVDGSASRMWASVVIDGIPKSCVTLPLKDGKPVLQQIETVLKVGDVLPGVGKIFGPNHLAVDGSASRMWAAIVRTDGPDMLVTFPLKDGKPVLDQTEVLFKVGDDFPKVGTITKINDMVVDSSGGRMWVNIASYGGGIYVTFPLKDGKPVLKQVEVALKEKWVLPGMGAVTDVWRVAVDALGSRMWVDVRARGSFGIVFATFPLKDGKPMLDQAEIVFKDHDLFAGLGEITSMSAWTVDRSSGRMWTQVQGQDGNIFKAGLIAFPLIKPAAPVADLRIPVVASSEMSEAVGRLLGLLSTPFARLPGGKEFLQTLSSPVAEETLQKIMTYLAGLLSGNLESHAPTLWDMIRAVLSSKAAPPNPSASFDSLLRLPAWEKVVKSLSGPRAGSQPGTAPKGLKAWLEAAGFPVKGDSCDLETPTAGKKRKNAIRIVFKDSGHWTIFENGVSILHWEGEPVEDPTLYATTFEFGSRKYHRVVFKGEFAKWLIASDYDMNFLLIPEEQWPEELGKTEIYDVLWAHRWKTKKGHPIKAGRVGDAGSDAETDFRFYLSGDHVEYEPFLINESDPIGAYETFRRQANEALAAQGDALSDEDEKFIQEKIEELKRLLNFLPPAGALSPVVEEPLPEILAELASQVMALHPGGRTPEVLPAPKEGEGSESSLAAQEAKSTDMGAFLTENAWKTVSGKTVKAGGVSRSKGAKVGFRFEEEKPDSTLTFLGIQTPKSGVYKFTSKFPMERGEDPISALETFKKDFQRDLAAEGGLSAESERIIDQKINELKSPSPSLQPEPVQPALAGQLTPAAVAARAVERWKAVLPAGRSAAPVAEAVAQAIEGFHWDGLATRAPAPAEAAAPMAVADLLKTEPFKNWMDADGVCRVQDKGERGITIKAGPGGDWELQAEIQVETAGNLHDFTLSYAWSERKKILTLGIDPLWSPKKFPLLKNPFSGARYSDVTGTLTWLLSDEAMLKILVFPWNYDGTSSSPAFVTNGESMAAGLKYRIFSPEVDAARQEVLKGLANSTGGRLTASLEALASQKWAGVLAPVQGRMVSGDIVRSPTGEWGRINSVSVDGTVSIEWAGDKHTLQKTADLKNYLLFATAKDVFDQELADIHPPRQAGLWGLAAVAPIFDGSLAALLHGPAAWFALVAAGTWLLSRFMKSRGYVFPSTVRAGFGGFPSAPFTYFRRALLARRTLKSLARKIRYPAPGAANRDDPRFQNALLLDGFNNAPDLLRRATESHGLRPADFAAYFAGQLGVEPAVVWPPLRWKTESGPTLGKALSLLMSAGASVLASWAALTGKLGWGEAGAAMGISGIWIPGRGWDSATEEYFKEEFKKGMFKVLVNPGEPSDSGWEMVAYQHVKLNIEGYSRSNVDRPEIYHVRLYDTRARAFKRLGEWAVGKEEVFKYQDHFIGRDAKTGRNKRYFLIVTEDDPARVPESWRKLRLYIVSEKGEQGVLELPFDDRMKKFRMEGVTANPHILAEMVHVHIQGKEAANSFKKEVLLESGGGRIRLRSMIPSIVGLILVLSMPAVAATPDLEQGTTLFVSAGLFLAFLARIWRPRSKRPVEKDEDLFAAAGKALPTVSVEMTLAASAPPVGPVLEPRLAPRTLRLTGKAATARMVFDLLEGKSPAASAPGDPRAGDFLKRLGDRLRATPAAKRRAVYEDLEPSLAYWSAALLSGPGSDPVEKAGEAFPVLLAFRKALKMEADAFRLGYGLQFMRMGWTLGAYAVQGGGTPIETPEGGIPGLDVTTLLDSPLDSAKRAVAENMVRQIAGLKEGQKLFLFSTRGVSPSDLRGALRRLGGPLPENLLSRVTFVEKHQYLMDGRIDLTLFKVFHGFNVRLELATDDPSRVRGYQLSELFLIAPNGDRIPLSDQIKALQIVALQA